MNWCNFFLMLSDDVSKKSKDPTTKVGAVIVDKNNRVVSVGFNGFPRGVEDSYTNREEKLRRTIHAEVNAILFAKQDLEGCTLYVTHQPCAQCTATLIQAGIRHVVFFEPRADFASRWQDDLASSMQMLKESGVTFDQVERK